MTVRVCACFHVNIENKQMNKTCLIWSLWWGSFQQRLSGVRRIKLFLELGAKPSPKMGLLNKGFVCSG